MRECSQYSIQNPKSRVMKTLPYYFPLGQKNHLGSVRLNSARIFIDILVTLYVS